MCIDDNNGTDCGTYIYCIKNIILGQEITIDACVLDYYDQPAGETHFLVDSNNTDIDIDIEKWKTASVQLFFSSAQNKYIHIHNSRLQ